MSVYYNEFEPYAAQWLKNLIRKGLIADGYVDDRSIHEVRGVDLQGYSQCHFFAGIGVWQLALRNAGWGDTQEVWTGSCPCQPFSVIGTHKGEADKRHLWPEFFRLIKECKPKYVFGEQVASKDGITWLDNLQTDMEGEGYATGATVFPACGVGSPHIRPRTYWVGHSQCKGLEGYNRREVNINEPGRNEKEQGRPSAQAGVCNGFWSDYTLATGNGYCKPIQPSTPLLVNGTPQRVGRIRAYGNAIVEPQARVFIESYMEVMNI